VAIGWQAGGLTQGTGGVAIGYNAGLDVAGTGAVSVGYFAGNTAQGANSVAVGIQAGMTDQGLNSVAIGSNAGTTTQGSFSVAIGDGAGESSQGGSSVAVGALAGQTNQGGNALALGVSAGQTAQGGSAIAIGDNCATTNQGSNAVAIGINAGQVDQSSQSIAIGSSAGQFSQSQNTVAIGTVAGFTGQGVSSVAVGFNAGAFGQQASSVALGDHAGFSLQQSVAVAVGAYAGHENQGSGSVAIGGSAGFTGQGINAVALGFNAGQINQGQYAIAIGANSAPTNQPTGSICINASGVALNPAEIGLFVNPIRNTTDPGATYTLVYNSSTAEITALTGVNLTGPSGTTGYTGPVGPTGPISITTITTNDAVVSTGPSWVVVGQTGSGVTTTTNLTAPPTIYVHNSRWVSPFVVGNTSATFDADYTSIGAAVSVANGATFPPAVQIRAGSYTEAAISITGPMTFIGYGGVIWTGGSSSITVNVPGYSGAVSPPPVKFYGINFVTNPSITVSTSNTVPVIFDSCQFTNVQSMVLTPTTGTVNRLPLFMTNCQWNYSLVTISSPAITVTTNALNTVNIQSCFFTWNATGPFAANQVMLSLVGTGKFIVEDTNFDVFVTQTGTQVFSALAYTGGRGAAFISGCKFRGANNNSSAAGAGRLVMLNVNDYNHTSGNDELVMSGCMFDVLNGTNAAFYNNMLNCRVLSNVFTQGGSRSDVTSVFNSLGFYVSGIAAGTTSTIASISNFFDNRVVNTTDPIILMTQDTSGVTFNPTIQLSSTYFKWSGTGAQPAVSAVQVGGAGLGAGIFQLTSSFFSQQAAASPPWGVSNTTGVEIQANTGSNSFQNCSGASGFSKVLYSSVF
jgi:hypothetical protein